MQALVVKSALALNSGSLPFFRQSCSIGTAKKTHYNPLGKRLSETLVGTAIFSAVTRVFGTLYAVTRLGECCTATEQPVAGAGTYETPLVSFSASQ